MTDRRMMSMLIALCAAVFFVTSAGASLAPFLNLIAGDLDTTLPAVAHLFSVQALTWGIASLVAGVISERFGQRMILVGGIALLGVMRLGFSTADSYGAAVVWQILSGIGGGAFMGIVYAVVSEHVTPDIRGRAMSWVITGQSLSLVLGVPLVTLLGAIGGWRSAIATHGTCVLICAIIARLATPPDPARQPHAARPRVPYAALFNPRLMALLAAGTTERMCFAVIAIFLPAYLQHTYDTALGGLALVLGLVAAGNLIGNILGGRIADRTRKRARLFAIGSALTAVVVLPLMAWHPGLGVSVTLGFVFSFVNAAGRPSLMATLAEMPAEMRSTLFGLNITMASMGWLLAGSVGGWLIAVSGFAGLGVFCALVAALGCGLALFSASKPIASMR
ncbi:MAG: MFS transporter [Betaproteobacteria bacterium]|jgi:DHA1 family inner membrane transport protein